ncbi:hypothetical protein ACHQM5_011354 [Ranunculus cassubicifolius]
MSECSVVAMASLNFVFVLLLLSSEVIEFCLCGETYCVESERNALLKFKKSLTDPSNRLSSWDGNECCTWEGVGCDTRTRHVVKIDLRNPHPFKGNEYDQYTGFDERYSKASLQGKELDPSLLELKYLNYLDLSWNNFSRSTIPKFLGLFNELRYLNLSSAWFSGKVPHDLGNISTLESLDLNSMYADIFYSHVELWSDSLQWISHLYSLRYLDMSHVNLSQASDWQYKLHSLPSLLELRLYYCQLHRFSPYFSISNSTRLVVLELSENNFGGEIPDYFQNLTSLEVIDLSENSLVSPIPSWLGNHNSLTSLSLDHNLLSGQLENVIGNSTSGHLKKLRYLSLVGNSFSGPIPNYLGSFSQLRQLYLVQNKLNGTIPISIGNLSELREIWLDSNSLKGSVSEDHFAKLSKLELLSLRDNQLVWKVGSHWVPPFQLRYFLSSSCTVGPKFPAWLKTQSKLISLDIGSTGISDSLPNWVETHFPSLMAVDLSYNQIRGRVPSFLSSRVEKMYLYLRSNKFEGPLPNFPSSLVTLDLYNNSISGPLPKAIGNMLPALQAMHLSSNSINGSIPTSVCAMKYLIVLDISKNLLSGDLPQCWMDSQRLEALILGFNNLTGVIPNSIGHLGSLTYLHLENNNFYGKIPLGLQNSSRLYGLNLGVNKLSGSIPRWIGIELSLLKVLRLRSNLFNGKISPQLCHLTSLRILDFAQNNLSGTIPSCIGNFHGMVLGQERGQGGILGYDYVFYEEGLVQTLKGRDLEYDRVPAMLVNFDISSNNLEGEIPRELTFLSGLIGLNLSKNHFTGGIPKEIGQLSSLESLDLSNNNISGQVPQSLSNLTALSHLNVSFNNLSGQVPSGNQIQTLDDPSIYEGNSELCGDLLKKKCKEDEEPSNSTKFGGGKSILSGFYIGLASGFVFGFWGVCFSLLLKKSWRYFYFRFVDNTKDMLNVKMTVMVSWLQKMVHFHRVRE